MWKKAELILCILYEGIEELQGSATNVGDLTPINTPYKSITFQFFSL